jgi:hypothetical protein
MLRSVLVQGGTHLMNDSLDIRLIRHTIGQPVYAMAWAPDNDQVLYTNGRNLVIKPIQAGKKATQVIRH